MEELEWRSKLNVLIVDDGADSRTTMKTLLSIQGYQADAAPSGPDALSILEYQWADVILLDLRMPGMDGYQLAKLIQEKRGPRPKPLMIAVTGVGGPLAHVCSRMEGIDHHLVKPVDFRELDSLIDQWRNRRAQDANDTPTEPAPVGNLTHENA
jgi:CheY-like chemotaxis protein